VSGKVIVKIEYLASMAKKEATKADLLKEIELKVQDLNLLQSALKADRSRKPETLAMYEKKYLELLKR
jgi:hypothetical protein